MSEFFVRNALRGLLMQKFQRQNLDLSLSKLAFDDLTSFLERVYGPNWTNKILDALMDPENFSNSFDAWFQMWLNNWRTRVQFTTKPRKPRKNSPWLSKKLSPTLKRQLVNYAKDALIQRSEFVALDLVAEEIVQTAMRNLSRKRRKYSKETELILSLLHEIHLAVEQLLRPGNKFIKVNIRNFLQQPLSP